MLAQSFFEGDTVEAARSLVGKYLVRQYGGLTLAARITETEAYVGRMDKACHAYGYRRTERTKTLYATPGTAYVYLIYGMHCCLNFVTEPEGEPAAVLIRSLSPRHNQDIIAENRFHCKCGAMTAYQKKNFLNGPGKVCAGLNIDRRLNGLPYGSPELFLCERLEELGLPTPPRGPGAPGAQNGQAHRHRLRRGSGRLPLAVLPVSPSLDGAAVFW